MSILRVASRPVVPFDVADRSHREYYMIFLQRQTWRECPVQFYLEKGYGDLASMIENKLTAYYLAKEFKSEIPDRSDQWATR